MRRQRIRRRMRRAQHGIFNRCSRKRRAEQHSSTRFKVIRIFQHDRKNFPPSTEMLLANTSGKRIAFCRHRGFNGVRDGVNSRASRDACWLGNCQCGIKNRNARRRFRIQTRHFLMRDFICDQRRALAFASRSRRRGNCNHRQHRLSSLCQRPNNLSSRRHWSEENCNLSPCPSNCRRLNR